MGVKLLDLRESYDAHPPNHPEPAAIENDRSPPRLDLSIARWTTLTSGTACFTRAEKKAIANGGFSNDPRIGDFLRSKLDAQRCLDHARPATDYAGGSANRRCDTAAYR
jgi:hypothetical protein